VPTTLRVFCETIGMGFAAVARVTDASWTACAVQDNIRFGLCAGGELDVDTTLSKEVRQARAPIVIERASTDPVYRGHHTPRLYGIESYLSVSIVRPGRPGGLRPADREAARRSVGRRRRGDAHRQQRAPHVGADRRRARPRPRPARRRLRPVAGDRRRSRRALAGVVAELSDAHPGRVIESRIDIAAPVRCNAGRLQQLASNMLANALVHSTQDRPIEFVAETR